MDDEQNKDKPGKYDFLTSVFHCLNNRGPNQPPLRGWDGWYGTFNNATPSGLGSGVIS